ncbi:MAG: hypothetical protein NT154_05100 [Verrucomicrobia bacterium]|nr:hypothetical protein [Verrucomicrobiota bacterium]
MASATSSSSPWSCATSRFDNIADVLKEQVERRLLKLLDELAGVRFVASRRQLVMNGQAMS